MIDESMSIRDKLVTKWIDTYILPSLPDRPPCRCGSSWQVAKAEEMLEWGDYGSYSQSGWPEGLDITIWCQSEDLDDDIDDLLDHDSPSRHDCLVFTMIYGPEWPDAVKGWTPPIEVLARLDPGESFDWDAYEKNFPAWQIHRAMDVERETGVILMNGCAGGRFVPQVGRNDDCPCGSGQKFKYCHAYRAGSESLPKDR